MRGAELTANNQRERKELKKKVTWSAENCKKKSEKNEKKKASCQVLHSISSKKISKHWRKETLQEWGREGKYTRAARATQNEEEEKTRERKLPRGRCKLKK